VQAVFTYQVGTHARQVAFVGTGEAFVEQGRNGGLQYRVAKEFEALVVVCTGASVRQRAREQRRLREAVAQALLQRVQPCVH